MNNQNFQQQSGFQNRSRAGIGFGTQDSQQEQQSKISQIALNYQRATQSNENRNPATVNQSNFQNQPQIQAFQKAFGNFNQNQIDNRIKASLPLSIEQQQLAIAQHQLNFQELSKKVCISRLPLDSTDEIVRKMLSCCGVLKSWKRFQDANGNPKDGGIAEFEAIEGVFSCNKFLNNMKLKEQVILVKANQKTQQYLNDIRDLKREEFLDYLREQNQQNYLLIQQLQQNQNNDQQFDQKEMPEIIQVPAAEDLKAKEELCDAVKNGVEPYEMELISGGPDGFEAIKEQLTIIINQYFLMQNDQNESSHDGQYLKKSSVADQYEKKKNEDYKTQQEETDPLLKFKEHERERMRERKIKNMEMERQMKYQKKLNELLRWEQNRERERKREQQKLQNLETVRQQLIEDDLQYDSQEEERLSKKYPKEYQKWMDDRKKIREQENLEDEEDRQLELKEIQELEAQKLEQLKKKEERKKLREEKREQLKLKRFMEMQHQYEEQQRAQADILKRQKLEEQEVSKQDLFQSKSHAQQSAKPQQQQLTAQQIEKLREVYKMIPLKKQDLYEYKLDWNSLFENDIIEKVCRPWIAKKIVEYMGAEEQSMINIVVKLLKQKCTDRQLFGKIESILDDASEEFVEKLWRLIVFEDLKIKNVDKA